LTRREFTAAIAAAAQGRAQRAPAGAGPLSPVNEAGYPRLLAAHKGQVLLVDFWATWCSPCLEELPLLVALENRYRAKGFILITVSCDEPEEAAAAAKVIRESRAAGPAYLKTAEDNEKFIDTVDRKWRGALPALFLYDRSGRLVKSFVGETEMAAVEAEIRKLL